MFPPWAMGTKMLKNIILFFLGFWVKDCLYCGDLLFFNKTKCLTDSYVCAEDEWRIVEDGVMCGSKEDNGI